jgi:MoaD family protein
MKLRVKYTAQLRSILQCSGDEIDLPAASSLAELLQQVAERHPAGRLHLLNDAGQAQASLLVVVNDGAVSARDAASVQLREGDTVLLLPPIAGG